MTVLVFFPNRFNVPWAVHLYGWEFFPTDWLVPLVLLGVWVLRPVSPPETAVRWGPNLSVPLAGWFGVSLVSTLISSNDGVPLGHKLVALSTVTLWTLPVFIVPAMRLTKRETLTLILVYASLGVVGGLLSCFQSLRIREFSALLGWKYVYGIADSERRADLPLGVSTVISYFFISIIPMGFALFTGEDRFSSRMLGLLTILAVGTGVLFTTSREAYVLLFIVALACVFWVRLPGSSRMLPMVGLAALVVLVTTAMTELNFERITTLRDGSFGWRYRGIEAASGMIAENPLIGLGIETHFRRQHGPVRGYFATEKPHDAIYYNNKIAPSDAHNTYLLVASESGLFGLMFLLILLGKIGVWFYRCQARCGHPRNRLWVRVFLIGFAAMLVHSLAGTDLVRQTRMAPLFWIYCGLGLSLGNGVSRLEPVGTEGSEEQVFRT